MKLDAATGGGLAGGITEAVALETGDNVSLRVQGMGSNGLRFV
jgi:2-oxo-3-hexenedioate decarboxylase